MNRKTVFAAYMLIARADELRHKADELSAPGHEATNLSVDVSRPNKTSFKVGVDPDRFMVDAIVAVLRTRANELDRQLQAMGIEP